MDVAKVEKAKKINGKIQGMIWNRERNEEYHHYDAAKECQRIIEQLYKELKDLHLTKEESIVACNEMDMKVAEEWYGRY